ncbi:MAG TPA: HAMP domain-containing sensor histidine kinase [Treponemataceae bacterium]|nr:HAMP domain-containing sensor histidine kinase [Treponemataceae bacterium]
MKQGFFSHIIIPILATTAALLVAVFAFLLVGQEKKFRSSLLEFKTFQILTDILDVYNTEGSFDSTVWPEVVGFALYSSSGQALYRFGSAPLALKDARYFMQHGFFKHEKKTLIMVRPVGAFHLTQMEGMPGQRRGMTSRVNRFAFIAIDIYALNSETNTIYIVLYILFCVFLVVLGIVFFLSRRVSRYRLQVEESAHLVQLGEAARTLVHEIKNPLGVIRVQCATLKKTVPQERIPNIAVIEEETIRLSNLADRVRVFLQSSEGSPAKFPCGYFLDKCNERYGKELVIRKGEGSHRIVNIDSERMLQILDNLIKNAQESSDQQLDSSLPILSVTASRSRALFQVTDFGTGVPEKNASRLFDLFYTTKAQGSGIGLALSQRFAQQAGGQIFYEKGSERGSVFTVSLPIVEEGKST